MAWLSRRTLGVVTICVVLLSTVGLYIRRSSPQQLPLSLGSNSQFTKPLRPLRLQPLPLGSITPRGWLREELQASADGLAGHEYDFYEYVARSPWLGGDREYAKLNEGFPYWFNGLVYLAYGLQDERLKAQVHAAADHVLVNQQDDGWIGPESDDGSRIFWGRYPFFLGLIGLAEANSTWTARVTQSLHYFVVLMWTMLKDDGKGYVWHPGDKMTPRDYSWGQSRSADLALTLMWLIEHEPRGQDEKLLEIVDILYQKGVKWESWYNEHSYMKEDTQISRGDLRPYFEYKHGVNVAQGLKSPAVFWRLTGNDSLKTTARNGVDWSFTHHGSPSGTIIADDTIRGQMPFAGAELCTTVEAMFSLSYLYHTFGTADYADRCERAAFNALPAMMTTDWWAHQYMQQSNQPFSMELKTSPFGNTNTLAQTFGLEPNLPCCTLNHPQGLPKFLAASFVSIGRSGLAHVLLSPAKADLTLASGAHVSVDCDTAYPFADDLHYAIHATAAFTFYIRIPAWSAGRAVIRLRGQPLPGAADPETGLFAVNLRAGTSKLTVSLSPQMVVERRANDAVSISRGALVYALAVAAHVTSTRPHSYSNMSEFDAGYAPPAARDYRMTNASAWNVAIDPSTLQFHVHPPMAAPEAAGSAFAADAAHAGWMTADGCEVAWPLYEDSVPDAVPAAERRACVGGVARVTLRPVGGAKLHMMEMPTMRRRLN